MAISRMTRSARSGVSTLALLIPIAALSACGFTLGSTDDATVRSNGGGTVVSGPALLDGHGSVLESLRGKVPGLNIRNDGDPCPRITLRNDAAHRAQVTPLVYVDGTRTMDTCILESLRSRDVEMVEVYPTGVTKRPGYLAHPHGLILVFLRS